MRASRVRSVAAILVLLSAASCAKAPNTVVEGVVQTVSRVRPSCLKILSIFGGCGENYHLQILSNTSEKWFAWIATSRTEEDWMRRIIGEQVTVRCYRTSGMTFLQCSEELSSLVWNGQELRR